MFILHHGISSYLDFFSKSQSEVPPFRLSHIVSYTPWLRCMASDLCLSVFLVPGIYIEIYVYDDRYVHILMAS